MAEDVASLEIRIESGSADRAKKSLADLSAQGASAEASMRKVGQGGADASSGVDKYTKSTDKASSATGSLVTSLKATAAAYISFQSAAAVGRIADDYTKLSAQLKLSTNSQQEFATAYANAISIARSSQSDLGAISTLYARLNNSLKDLGATQGQVASIAETVALSLKVSGAGASETASAMLQLSQAFGSGVLRGEEFNAVAEAAPGLLRVLAQSIGVPVGQLRTMASEGKLTADVLARAFSDPKVLQGLRDQAKEVQTIASGFVSLKNEITLTIGELDKASGASKAFASTLDSVAKGIAKTRETGNIEASPVATLFTKLTEYGLRYLGVLDEVQKKQNSIGGKIKNSDGSERVVQQPELKTQSATFASLTADIKSAIDIRAEYSKIVSDIIKAANQEGIANDIVQAKIQAVTEKYYGRAKAVKDTATSTQAENTYAKELASTYADLFKAAEALTAPQETQIERMQRQLDGYKNLDAASKQFLQSYIDLANVAADDSYIVAQQRASDAIVESINKQADGIEQQIAAYGKLDSQITSTNLANLKGLRDTLAAEGLVTDAIDTRIEALERLRAAQVSKEFTDKQAQVDKERADAAKRTADEIQRKYETTSDSINRSLTDALLRGFESGKGFAENFKDTLINMFKTLVLQPIVRFLVDSSGISKIATLITSSLSGTASASGIASDVAGGGSGAGSFISLAKNIYSGITSGFDSLNASLVGKIGDLGTFLVDKGFNNLGGVIGQYNSVIASALPYSAAILKLVQGDVKGAAVTGITTAIGSAIGGPVGGAIGAAVGSLLGGVFGGGTPLRNWAQVSSTYSKADEMAVTNIVSKRGGAAVIDPLKNVSKTFYEQIDGFLEKLGKDAALSLTAGFSTRPGKSTVANLSGTVDGNAFSLGQFKYSKKDSEAWTKYINTVFGQGIVAAIQASDISQGFKELFSGFTDKDQVASLMQSVINFQTASEELADTYGITADTAAKIAKAGGATNEEISAFAKTFSEFSLSLMKPSEQLLLAKTNITSAIEDIVGSVGSLDSLSAFDSLLKGIDTTTAEGQAQFADLFKLRDSFSAYFASLTSIKDNVQSSLFNLYSPGDQAAFLQGELEKAFSSLDLAVPTSVDELIKLGQSIDYTTEAGLDLAAAFPGLVTAFTNAQSATDSLVESLNSLDTSRFKTLFDYERYKAVATNFGTTYANNYQKTALPAFDVGTNYVPSDMTAQIHKGERIIPAADNAALMKKLDQSSNADLLNAFQQLKQINESLAKNVASMERKLSKWDGDGLPAERVLA